MPKFLLIFFTFALSQTACARSFKYGLILYRGPSDRVVVDIFSELPVTERRGLSLQEAKTFLESAPYSMGPNEISVVVKWALPDDVSQLLKLVIQKGWDLRYFECDDSLRMRDYIVRRHSESPQKDVTRAK
jgi:hypothetical protein